MQLRVAGHLRDRRFEHRGGLFHRTERDVCIHQALQDRVTVRTQIVRHREGFERTLIIVARVQARARFSERFGRFVVHHLAHKTFGEAQAYLRVLRIEIGRAAQGFERVARLMGARAGVGDE